MFTWLNKQGVKSPKGFALQSMHRFYYHYIEDDHVMRVNVEPGINHEKVYWGGTQKWEPPHDGEAISHDKLAEIQRNISDALTFMGIPHGFSSK
jgi:hypothetical protein